MEFHGNKKSETLFQQNTTAITEDLTLTLRNGNQKFPTTVNVFLKGIGSVLLQMKNTGKQVILHNSPIIRSNEQKVCTTYRVSYTH